MIVNLSVFATTAESQDICLQPARTQLLAATVEERDTSNLSVNLSQSATSAMELDISLPLAFKSPSIRG